MKNYLFYPGHIQNWYINFNLLEAKVINLQTYLSFFNPRYVQHSFTSDFYDNDKNILFNKLLPHHYLYITEENYKINGNKISSGMILISNARNEGESVETSTAKSIQSDYQYYFLQPLGYATYYTLAASKTGITNTFDEFADSHYGLKYHFAFTFTNARWIAAQQDNGDINLTEATFYFPDIIAGSEITAGSKIYGGNISLPVDAMLPGVSIQYQSSNFVDELITDYTIKKEGSNNTHMRLDFWNDPQDLNTKTPNKLVSSNHTITYVLF